MRKYDISVRNLVEFILRHGNIEPGSGLESPERAMAGTRIHKKLQSAFKEADHTYEPEKSVSYSVKKDGFDFVISGRADGIRFKDGFLHIDEIKTVDKDVKSISEPERLHIAQGRCYAAILSNILPDVKKVETNVIYCNIENMEVNAHGVVETPEEAMDFFQGLVDEYVKWIKFYRDRQESVASELGKMSFPYGEYRTGQRELAISVYRTIKDGGKMFANAPTGIGKTVSTLFPALKAMGEGLTSKVFYLTARNAGALPPQEAADIMRQQVPELSYINLTSKEKVCPYGLKCDPVNCPRANGHFDRVNSALWEVLHSEKALTREKINSYGEEFNVCPFELALDCSYFTQVIIGDYNYLFDPRVKLNRFFGASVGGNYTFLIDEAHNLPDRVRGMYTVSINSKKYLSMGEEVKSYSRGFYNGAMAVGEFLNNIGNVLRDQDMMMEFSFSQDDSILGLVENFCEKMSRFTDTKTWKQKMPEDVKNRMMELYFESLFYLKISDLYDEKFCFLKEIQSDGSFTQTLFCADPSGVINETCKLGNSSIFFSGTLAPMTHYIDIMGGTRDDVIVDVPSPFPMENRLSLGAYDVATTYKKRGQYFEKAAEYVERLTELPVGNYMVFYLPVEDKNAVAVIRIMYGGRNIEKQLAEDI